jgi:hypothetical protein
LFALLAAVASRLEPRQLGCAATAIVVIVAAWELVSMKSLRD